MAISDENAFHGSAGYSHSVFAESFREFGVPIALENSGGWIIRRRIKGVDHYDGMGCYPLFSCRNWSNLGIDFEKIKTEVIALSLVTDPFGNYSEKTLKAIFPDVVKPYKRHYIAELEGDIENKISKHHRRNIKKAMGNNVAVERSANPADCLKKWCDLYENLKKRHGITGIRSFSESCFETQLNVPGTVLFEACWKKTIVGMIWWYVVNNVAYYHLGAFSKDGYYLGASFLLFWTAMNYFKKYSAVNILNFGSGAGIFNEPESGLSKFKKGWSTKTKTAYFCGVIFDKSIYGKILRSMNTDLQKSNYFPEYRQGEFQ